MTPGSEIVGAFEHPTRRSPDTSTHQLLAEVVRGALDDAGLAQSDVDGLFCDALVGKGPQSAVEYLGLTNLTHFDSTDTGGSSYIVHVGHAAAAIAAGRCRVAVIAMAGRGLSAPGSGPTYREQPADAFEAPFGAIQVSHYALIAQRHMYEYGTTTRQLAEIRSATSSHAQYNDRALYPSYVTVDEVLDSPLVSDPLRRLDCCVTTDGGGALVIVHEAVARDLRGRSVSVLGQGEAIGHTNAGRVSLVRSAATESGARAFAAAGVTPSDIDYASIYDSFTITVLQSLEDLSFCERGQGGPFVASGALRAPGGALPINTDGGGLCNNHPGRRGGMPRLIEAVRQLRGEAHAAVQVPDCELALVHGTGGSLATRHVCSTVILGR